MCVFLLNLVFFFLICRVHFIPLSTTYREIYNVVTYFSGPTPSMLLAANSSSSSMKATFSEEGEGEEEGEENAREALQDQEGVSRGGRKKVLTSVEADRRLKRIARAGKEWKRTMGRKVDMQGKSFFFFFPRD